MKNTLAKRFSALLLCICILTVTTAAWADSYGVIFGTDSLNLRSQGSSSSQWLGQYPRGTWVEIIGSQNNFYQVVLPDGKIGYMSKNYIDTTGDVYQSRQVAIVSNQNGGSFLNFRQQPSYSAQVLGIFYTGVPLCVIGQYSGWYMVEINGQVGYVRSEFVTTKSIPASSTVATIKTPNNSALNLRSGPGMTYPVIKQYRGDQYVMVLAEGNGWWRVAVNDTYGFYVGFMDSSFLVKGLHSAKDQAVQNGNGAGGDSYALVANPKPTQTLNLRQHSTITSTALTQLRNNTRLLVDEQGTEWCRVTVQQTGLSGYVMTRYIRLYNLPSTPTRTVVHPSGSYVNLRAKPDMVYGQVLSRVPSGSRVTILIPGSDWCKVSYNGQTGYMLSCFLRK